MVVSWYSLVRFRMPNYHMQPNPAITSLFHAERACRGRLMCSVRRGEGHG